MSAPYQQAPPRRELSQVIFRNALVVTLASWALKAVKFCYLIAVVRLLGDSGYGQYTATLAFVGMFGVFFELGLTQYVERSLAQDPGRTRELLGNLIALRLLLSGAAMILLPLGAYAMGYAPELVLGVLLYSGSFALAALLDPLATVISAAERFDVRTAVEVRGQILSIILGLPILIAGGGFLGLLAVGFLVLPVQIVLALRAIRRLGLGPLAFNVGLPGWPALLRAGIPFGITSLALTFNFHADTVILSGVRSIAEVGWYNASYNLIFRLVALADGLLLTMTPSLAREQVHDPGRVQAWSSAAVGGLIFVGLPAAMGLCALAAPIAAALFGAEFAPTAPVLALLAWDLPLLLFTAFCGNVAAATGREWAGARIYGLSTALNLGLNLALIPHYGMLAAAAITLLTDGLSAVLFVALLGSSMRLGRLAPQLLRVVLATIAMGALVVAARDLPLPLTVGLGVMTYGVLAVLLRLVDPALLTAQISSLLGRTFGAGEQAGTKEGSR